MEDWLNNPMVQGGIAPFVIGLLIAGVFMKVRNLAALALVGGVLTTVLLSTGLNFDPLTSTRKIILLILVIPIIALVLDLFHAENKTQVIPAFYVIVAASLVWVLWPVLSRDPAAMILPVLGYIAYAVWMTGMFLRLVEMPRISAATASTATGFGIGIVALTGASALLGQIGLAFGAAASAYLLTQIISRNDEPAGFTFTLSSAFTVALLLPAAVVYAKVPWVALPIMALVPLFAFYPFDEDTHIIKNVIGILFVMAIPIGAAIYFTVQAAGAPMM